MTAWFKHGWTAFRFWMSITSDSVTWRHCRSTNLYFSTFFGGGSSIWATSKDEVAFFDDFVVTARQPGDFDFGGDVDLNDLDQYIGNIGASPTGALRALDLDSDGDIDADDMNQHYTQLVETSNGAKGTFAGDLNLGWHRRCPKRCLRVN